MSEDGRILVTGGAGFIGSHIVDALLERGHPVTILDVLDPQVHGEARRLPGWTRRQLESGRVEFIQGDVKDPGAVERALEGVEVVYHQAAAVGVGQSMYRIADYVSANSLGAAVLLEAVTRRAAQVRRLVVASSMSIYGEGGYRCERHGVIHPSVRPGSQLLAREWRMRCPECGDPAEPIPTAESKPLEPTSVYAVTKRDHEELFLTLGRAYDIPTVALRYFNVYGPRQSLSNPYTGVAAIFSSRLLNGRPPIVFEDGRQSRDFIHVSDIVQANMLALDRAEVSGRAYNVGTGEETDLLRLVELLRAELGGPEPELIGRFRQGDIRSCFASIEDIRADLGFEPRVPIERGASGLARWAAEQEAEDRTPAATAELERAGLTV